jgi:hypothetical protein
MKKKTIKFYFYNSALKNPATSSLFCFSKRGFNYNRRFKSILSQLLKKKMSKNAACYETLRWNKITLNQWNMNSIKLKKYFCGSFFFTPPFLKKNKKTFSGQISQFKLWFKIKNNHNYFLLNFIRSYSMFGVLSSDVAHTLVRKNLSYQVWSKYKSKLFNMNFYYSWIYNNIRAHMIYNTILLCTLYNFSFDPRARPLYCDEDFNIITSSYLNTNFCSLSNVYRIFLNSNQVWPRAPIFINLDLSALKSIYLNKDLIEEAFKEPNNEKQLFLKNELESKISIDKNSIVIFARFFIFLDSPLLIISSIHFISLIKTYYVIFSRT